jgi:hypothetical protein
MSNISSIKNDFIKKSNIQDKIVQYNIIENDKYYIRMHINIILLIILIILFI